MYTIKGTNNKRNVTYAYLHSSPLFSLAKTKLKAGNIQLLIESFFVAVPLTVVYVILATAGLLFTVVCLAFNFIFRKRRWALPLTIYTSRTTGRRVILFSHRLIRLSSPNLNYIIGAGAIVLYADVILHVIPTMSPDVTTVICNVCKSIGEGFATQWHKVLA